VLPPDIFMNGLDRQRTRTDGRTNVKIEMNYDVIRVFPPLHKDLCTNKGSVLQQDLGGAEVPHHNTATPALTIVIVTFLPLCSVTLLNENACDDDKVLCSSPAA